MPDEGVAPKRSLRTDLTRGPLTRTLLLFSLPVLGSNVLQSLNGSVNALWVGRLLGEEALTATTNANLVLFFLLGAVFGVGLAATILVGQSVGAHDLDRVKRVIGTTATFFLAISVVTAIVGAVLTEPILRWMHTPPEVQPLAETYLFVIFLSMPFLYGFTFLMMVQRGAGDARTPFRFMLLAVALDIALNPLLILGVGPLPELGIAGSAWGMLISQAIALVAMLIYLYVRKSDLRLAGGELHYLLPNGALMRTLIIKGLPMGAQMAVISLSSIIMMSMINEYGAATAAAYGIAMQLWTYVQMPAMAIGAAASSVAAQYVGAGRWDRVEQCARSGVMIILALTGVLVVLLYLLDPILVRLFLPSAPDAIATAERINDIAGWSFVLFGVTFVLFGVVRSTGAVTPPLVILFISLFGVRITFAKLVEPYWGADAIWWSFPISMTVSMLLSVAYYRWGRWRSAQMAPPIREVVEDAPNTGAGVPTLDARVARADIEPEKAQPQPATPIP
jgi:putative MATE family efflux protein